MWMRRWMVRGATAACVASAAVAGCVTAGGVNVRQPIGVQLVPGATTGPQIPLRFDPTARVILSNAATFPPASFLASQAARGEGVYQATCDRCHLSSEFVGPAFVDSWNNRRVYDFYALVRATMPLDNPGGLKDGEYLDLIAYLLQANNAPPGLDSLKADTVALRRTRIAVR